MMETFYFILIINTLLFSKSLLIFKLMGALNFGRDRTGIVCMFRQFLLMFFMNLFMFHISQSSTSKICL